MDACYAIIGSGSSPRRSVADADIFLRIHSRFFPRSFVQSVSASRGAPPSTVTVVSAYLLIFGSSLSPVPSRVSRTDENESGRKKELLTISSHRFIDSRNMHHKTLTEPYKPLATTSGNFYDHLNSIGGGTPLDLRKKSSEPSNSLSFLPFGFMPSQFPTSQVTNPLMNGCLSSYNLSLFPNLFCYNNGKLYCRTMLLYLCYCTCNGSLFKKQWTDDRSSFKGFFHICIH